MLYYMLKDTSILGNYKHSPVDNSIGQLSKNSSSLQCDFNIILQ